MSECQIKIVRVDVIDDFGPIDPELQRKVQRDVALVMEVITQAALTWPMPKAPTPNKQHGPIPGLCIKGY